MSSVYLQNGEFAQSKAARQMHNVKQEQCLNSILAALTKHHRVGGV